MPGICDRFIHVGPAAVVVFWATLRYCGTRNPGYSHLTNLVSELGSQAAPTRYGFTLGLIVCSILSLMFVLSLVGTCRRRGLSPLPAYLILTFSFSIAGAGIFPMENPLHGILGMPSAVLFLSPVMAFVKWRRLPGLPLFAGLSLLGFLGGFFVFSDSVLPDMFGLKQRFFHLGWSVWFMYLAWGFRRKVRDSG